jgi:DNA repair exonuclease SbcCD nuclease subunit
MIKILHCADLHLSEAEKEYSLDVLKEIIDKAKSESVGYMLFCGDVFDSYQDLQSLQSVFCQMLSCLNNCKVLFLPGNHEELRCGNPVFDIFSWGSVELLAKKPWSLATYGKGEDQIEFLSIPHQKEYSGYLDWHVPQKEARYRIAMVHGFVSGMSFTGLDEEGGMVIDPGMFKEYKVDYAALGHVHKGETKHFEGITFCYPGSSRVVSKGEASERNVVLIQIDGEIRTKRVTLFNAGEYREYDVPLSLDGNINGIEGLAATWKDHDWIHLNLTGVVNDKNIVERSASDISQRYENTKIVRRLGFSTEDVTPVPDISSHPFAKRFLELWENMRVENETDIWNKARELVLNAVAKDEIKKQKR